jgi:beta-galactosidase beta subunit
MVKVFFLDRFHRKELRIHILFAGSEQIKNSYQENITAVVNIYRTDIASTQVVVVDCRCIMPCVRE